MDTTKNKLSNEAMNFFKGLSQYIDTNLLFFGSIQRSDYFPGMSDIDIDVFTDNEYSTMKKMQHYMQLPKKKFKRFMWHLNTNNRLVVGYKVSYKDVEKGIDAEFSIYNDKYKDDVLKEHRMKTVLPFYVSWLLIFLKYLYYKLKLLKKETFHYLKKKILALTFGHQDDVFIVLDKKSSTELNE